MARRIKIDVMPNRQADKLSCAASSNPGVVDPALPGECIIVIGDDVALHREVEIINGWRWLWNGLRDRDLLGYSAGIGGLGPIYSAAPIDQLDESNRLTSWNDVSGLTESMIGISVHDSVYELEGVQMIESAFTMLRDYFKENKPF